jgi:hydroxyacylglutathione hydrolase
MEETKFGPVRFIPGDNRGRYPFCHSLFVEGTRKVLIDPASNESALAALREDPGVDEVWLSHYHEDHFLYIDLFGDKTLGMSALDAPALASLESLLDYYDVPDEKERAAWGEFLRTYFSFRPRTADRFLQNGEVVDLGGVTVEVIATPGHTTGHLSFFVREEGLLFVGDYDLTPFPYYGDRDSEIDDTIASVERLRNVPAKVLISPHDKGIYREDFSGLWDRFLGVIDEREARLVELLAQPRTMEEIVEARIVYGKPREPKLFFDYGEMCIIRKHLKRLVAEGRAKKDGERWALVG